MKKIFCFAFTAILMLSGQASADLIISAAVDGTQTGGNPKILQLQAINAIADLSTFSLLRDTNGSTDGNFNVPSSFSALPAISLAAGDFFTVVGNAASDTFANTSPNAGFVGVGSVIDGIANQNGDDIIAISTDGTVAGIIDSLGLLGQGDTNFYTDSIAIRSNSAPNATGVLDGGNFTISAFDEQVFIDTFLVQVPEPGSFTFCLLAGLGLVARRRR